MRVADRGRVGKAIKVLEEQVRILESIGLEETASLLRIAWLDLKRRDGRVTIEELEDFCIRISAAVPQRYDSGSAPSGRPAAAAGLSKPAAAARTSRPRTPRRRVRSKMPGAGS
jgi:hypothetical protein